MERKDFCVECREIKPYVLIPIEFRKTIRQKEYNFEIVKAYCKVCNSEMILPGMLDKREKDIDEQYRKKENLVSIDDIKKLMEIYNIGKAPLSLALGFGEITVTRYLQGQVPTKEYSDIICKALESPKFMIDKLKENKNKIGEMAYNKSLKAAKELNKLLSVSEKMLSTISYIFERTCEITPLALQKLLYYIQGLYMAMYKQPLYSEDCQAWVHGPVYEKVYEMFKTFRYNPIDDNRFVMFKNRFKELTDDEKNIIDLVLETFGMYSGKTLEKLTHGEKPWKEAREGYLPSETSDVIISKESIRQYFESIAERYDISSGNEIRKYIEESLNLSK